MNTVINEYNIMWNKLNMITEHHNNLFIFTLTSSGAILTFSIQQNNAYIALVNMVILILLRCRVMNYRDDYFRTLAYIRCALEPKLNISSELLSEIPNSKISNIHFFVYTILGIGTVITYSYIDCNSKILIISLIILIFIIVLDCYYFYYSKNLYKNYYNDIKEKYNSQ